MTLNCPKCSSPNIQGAKFCQTCGCNLELESVNYPTCPKCKKAYPANTMFCTDDGTKLVRPEDLVPRCVICSTAYSDDTKFCPRDGGEVKVILTRSYQQSTHSQQTQYGQHTQQPQPPQQIFSTYHNPYQKYPKASLGNRFLAALLDGVITLGLAIPAIFIFIAAVNKLRYNDEEPPIGLFLTAFLFYLLPLPYGFIKDGLGQGQSWGKQALDLMVVNLDNGSPCDKGKSFFRNFISMLVGMIPFVGWLIEPIMVLATDDGRKLGDKAANTVVIDKRYYQ